ncbi:type III sulfide quinone reductase, selenoprotein subtype [Lewinella cohaerens]|uniref:type III sulfide quinone reductase, selenoprotein subtype n=1 Tax=Lewinella cohaerens TaxID=70995 RepID=UPI00039E9578|nr:FAD/NAD(P)-binding oxidoreductase [Lewinella cohaerens]
MKNLLILGAGTAGTMMANHLVKKLPANEWQITIVDKEKTHYYQPGYLFVPFDIYKPEQIVKSIDQFIPKGVKLVREPIDRIAKDEDQVYLANGEALSYDLLIVATGTDIAPDEIEGMLGEHWQESIFDFYTFDGASNLRKKLMNWEGGKMVVHICEMPIKCPVAPLEFAFLADSFFKNKGMRDKVDLTFVTPMDGAFTKPRATKELNYLLEQKNIRIVPNFNVERVDGEARKVYDYGGQVVDYDLLVTVPTNMGDPMIERSGMGDDLNFVPTNKATLQSLVKDNIFVIGDATNVPASKAGSVAHFEAEVLTENILAYIAGKEMNGSFDGHANCFVETGNGKALLIDFNYDQEPVTGTFPIPGVGPLRLLKESRVNHWGKLAFRWIYWNMLITGKPIPFVSSAMMTAGKDIEPAPAEVG